MFNAWRLPATGMVLAVLALAPGCGSQEDKNGSPPSDGGQTPGGAASGTDSPGSEAQPAVDPEPTNPVVVIETSLGNIAVQLDAEKADMTVENFLRYVDSGHYNGTIFHEVHKDHVIIGGAYTPELEEKKTDGPIFNQAFQGRKNLRGTIAMARKPDVIDSATCHFFINLQDHPNLDHKNADVPEEYGYCVFGEVIEGMEVADQIGNVAVHDTTDFEQIPIENVVIKSIRRTK